MIISSLSLNELALPERYDPFTLKYPLASVIDDILNKAKSSASSLFDILKCPLIVESESSIVLKNGCISVFVLPPSVSSMNNTVALDTDALFSLSLPAPGSESAVLFEKVYSNVAPPKFPCIPLSPC